MNFLCVCQYGHSRSVALARVLHQRGYHAVACGHQTAGPLLATLADAADRILILDDNMTPHVKQWSDKVVSIHIGPDVWSNPYNQDLIRILNQKVDEVLQLEQRKPL